MLALVSAKGSPGVTITVAALAACWPQDRPLLVVDADPAGGDLAPRLGLRADPGLVALAAEGRRELTAELAWRQVQPLPGTADARILVGPTSAEQASAALAALGARLGRLLAGMAGTDVILDGGRLDPGSPAAALLRVASRVIFVARPSVTQLHHLSTRVQALGPGVDVGLLLVGDRPYGVEEASRAVGVEALGTIADDAKAAGLLASGAAAHSRALRSSSLLRSVSAVAGTLVGRLGPVDAVAGAQVGAGAGEPWAGTATASEPPGEPRGSWSPPPVPVPASSDVPADPGPPAAAAGVPAPAVGSGPRRPRTRPLQARPGGTAGNGSGPSTPPEGAR